MRDGPKSIAKADRLMDTGTLAAAEKTEDDSKFPSSRGVLTAEEIEALLRPKPHIQLSLYQSPGGSGCPRYQGLQ